jgi:hypothetical protein
VAGRPLDLQDYIRILESKNRGVTFEFISARTKKPYKAQLVYRKKTKFNGKPGIELTLD